MSTNAPASLDNLLAAIAAWQQETFPNSTDYSRLTHLHRELRELWINPSSGEEMADIIFMVIAQATGNRVDLAAELHRKFEINLARTWAKPDAAGVVHHVGATPPEEDRVYFHWFNAGILLPDPEQVVAVYLPEVLGSKAHWRRACWIPHEYREVSFGDYEGDYHYSDEKDEFFWPAGWYEWNQLEDTHWLIDHPVTHWMYLELPKPQ